MWLRSQQNRLEDYIDLCNIQSFRHVFFGHVHMYKNMVFTVIYLGMKCLTCAHCQINDSQINGLELHRQAKPASK